MGGGSSASAENDRLRRERLELQARVADLEAQRDELRAKLAEAGRGGPLPPEALEALPRIASVEIDALSGARPAGQAGPITGVEVALRPLDGRRRFVQAVGTLVVEADLLPPAGVSDAPRRVLSRTLGPAELREAYRSGIAGTRYSVELPAEPPITARSGTLVVRVELRDALTGESHRAELARPLP